MTDEELSDFAVYGGVPSVPHDEVHEGIYEEYTTERHPGYYARRCWKCGRPFIVVCTLANERQVCGREYCGKVS